MRNEQGEIVFAISDCELGRVLTAKSASGICAVILGDNDGAMRDELTMSFPNHRLRRDDAACSGAVSVVMQAMEGGASDRSSQAALDSAGTKFQRDVWDELRTIERGQTRSYAEIARRIGRPGSARAVAQACASNRLAVLIPCHRVIRSDGAMSGYRWGVERKKRLLESESAV